MACSRNCRSRDATYVFSNTLRTFNDAVRNCASVGGELVTDLTARSLNSIRSCCYWQRNNQHYWIGIFRNNECPSQQFPYQMIGSGGECVREFPLAIQQINNNTNCTGVALERTRNSNHNARATERLCDQGARFICKFSRSRPVITTTTVPTTTAVPKTATADYTTQDAWFTEQNATQSPALNAISTEDIIVKSAVGGGVAFILLLFVIAVISSLCRKDIKEKKRVCTVESEYSDHRNITPLPDSYYSLDPVLSKRRNKAKANSRRTLSIPAIDPEAVHYIFPDSFPSPKNNDDAYHEYAEIDGSSLKLPIQSQNSLKLPTESQSPLKLPIEPTYEKVDAFSFNSNDRKGENNDNQQLKS